MARVKVDTQMGTLYFQRRNEEHLAPKKVGGYVGSWTGAVDAAVSAFPILRRFLCVIQVET